MAARSHAKSLGFKHRNDFRLLTSINTKTPKGEHAGYLTGVLYLMPHDSGGGKTLCPHSTAACREMCLAGAGLSGLPRQLGAKQARTDLLHFSQPAFVAAIQADVSVLADAAARAGVRAAVRLNGSSDIAWERLIGMDPAVEWYDYTAIPLEHRDLARAPHYHLTYSIKGSADMDRAIAYLRRGRSCAVVVPDLVKLQLLDRPIELDLGAGISAKFIDGDESDLRFLDPPRSVVLLRPKGRIRTDLVRPNIHNELKRAAHSTHNLISL